MINSLNLFLLSLWLFSLCHDVKTYSQISTYGGHSQDEGPKIFKATSADLIYPEIFNSSLTINSETRSPVEILQQQILPKTTTTTQNDFAPHQGAQDESVRIVATQAAPVVYVTPPTETTRTPPTPPTQISMQSQPLPSSLSSATQISFTPQTDNTQAIESNPLPDTSKNDYHRPPLQLATYDNSQRNYNRQNQLQQKQQQQQTTSTGRAVDYQPAYQSDQYMSTGGKANTAPARARPTYALRPSGNFAKRPQITQYSKSQTMPYPAASYRQYQRQRRPMSQSEIYKFNQGRAQISDRFTPGEAVASALFSQKGRKPQGHKIAAPTNFVQSYVAPKDLYSFPPNVNAKYPKPIKDSKIALPSNSVNSYAPPAAGPISSNVGYPLAAAASSSGGYKYPGPVSEGYLPPGDNDDDKTKDADDSKPADGNTADDDTIGVLPASAMDGGDDNKPDDDMNPMGMDMDSDDHDHDHHHDHDHPLSGYDTGKEYATPPPGWLEEHPDSGHFPHHYPDIIYDHHHDFHDHHHHHDEPPPPPSTEPPPPEPLPSEQPQEPRVKKYSYFYIGRKLWYIPLYFTVWFSFYVLWLILKSIARHKVNLPNHYVAKRSIPDYSEAKAKEHINQLTVTVLQQIENFQKKYLT